MTANKRIFLNIVATYGRSLYALIIGLIAGRWALMSLGQVDYGLMGLVGGLTGLVTFLNTVMAGAVGRFYAYAVGEAKNDPIKGLEMCRHWFNIAVTIHTVLPTVLMVVGYPLGVWAIENFLTIPPARVADCLWVWRFACISCFMGMISVPYNAMYNAKQEIAELTIYGIISTTLNFLFLSYMITHPGSWLLRYAAWTCFIAILPSLIIDLRALYVYSECRYVRRYLWNCQMALKLMNFAGGRFLCALSMMLSGQGKAILVNKFLGPVKNAAMAVGSSLTGHTSTLMSAFQGAFYPAITNAYGAGDLELARALCFRMCKFGTLSVLVFAAPLISEADNVLMVWLKNPPAGSAILCMLLIVEHCISRLVDGHWMIVFADGRVTGFNMAECVGYFANFAVVWLLLWIGMDIAAVGVGTIAATVVTVPVKLYFASQLGGLSVRIWVRRIAIPLVLLAALSMASGALVRLALPPTLFRIVLTTLVCEAVILPLTWVLVLDEDEKKFLIARISSVKGKIRGRIVR